MINIENADKAEVLAALYNNSKVQGMGYLQAKPGLMTVDEARELLKETTYFDYLYGKVMKIDLSTSELRPHLYDRDIGQGACASTLKRIPGVIIS
jgi:hypothetical protein